MSRRPDLRTLLDLAEARARHAHEGALTLFRFTTGWKGGFGTVDMDTGLQGTTDQRNGRNDVWRMPAFDSLEDVLVDMLVTDRRARP